MPRQRDPRRDEAFNIWKKRKGDITNREIANRLDVPEKTISAWKSKDNWNGVLQTNERSTPNERNTKLKRKRSGNPNPSSKFAKRNKEAERHGLFAKFLPEETLEIVDSILDSSKTLDLLWDQIRIQYAAILRSQKIMYVESKDDITQEVKKETEHGTEYEVQFAWDKQASFLNAQSRAISTLESLITKYEALLPNSLHAEEQRLKIEKLKVDIDKVKNDEDESVFNGLEQLTDAINRSIKGDS